MTDRYHQGQVSGSDKCNRAGGGILRDRRPFHCRSVQARKSPVMAFKCMFFRTDFLKAVYINAMMKVCPYWFIIAFITRLLTKSGLKIMHLKKYVNPF